MTTLTIPQVKARGHLGWRDGPFVSIGVVVAIAVLVPVLTSVWMSFTTGTPGSGVYTLENYREAFTDVFTYKVLYNTLFFASGAVIVSLLVAVPLAWLVARTDFPLKGLTITLSMLIVLIPGFIAAMGWVLLLSPRIGFINRILMSITNSETAVLNVYSLPAMTFIQGLELMPVAFFMLLASFKAVDPVLEEAAQTSGAGRLKTLVLVNFPLTLPAIVSVVVYIFMLAFSVFDIPGIIGMTNKIFVFSTLIFFVTRPDFGLPAYGLAGAYGSGLLVLSGIASYLYFRVARQSHKYVTVTGKGHRHKLIELGRWRPLSSVFCLSYFTLGLFLPLLTLLWASILPYFQPPSIEALSQLTARNYSRILDFVGLTPLLNTALLVVLTPVITVFLSLMVSWIVTRTRTPGRFILDGIAFLPLAVPRVLLATAAMFLALYGRNVAPIYGSIFLILIVQIIAFLSFGTRTMNSSLIQLHRELEEAGHTSGAGRMTVLLRIVVPLVSPALFYAWLWILLLSFREVTMALLLAGPGNTVLPVVIWNRWSLGAMHEAATIGVVIVAFMSVVLVFLRKLVERMSAELTF